MLIFGDDGRSQHPFLGPREGKKTMAILFITRPNFWQGGGGGGDKLSPDQDGGPKLLQMATSEEIEISRHFRVHPPPPPTSCNAFFCISRSVRLPVTISFTEMQNFDKVRRPNFRSVTLRGGSKVNPEGGALNIAKGPNMRKLKFCTIFGSSKFAPPPPQ